MSFFDCIVIGGGAAGLMCAGVAGNLGKRVLVLEHANKVGKKILMSGGGRCNFTNYFIEADNYLSQNPHFCKSALSRFTQYDFIDLVNQHQVAYHEKAKGQLFCDRKASDILDALLAECNKSEVKIATGTKVLSVKAQSSTVGSRYEIETSGGLYTCRSLVVATGGLSIPTMGASGFGYELAKQFGLKVTELVPSLVPFTLSGSLLSLCQQLSGVSIPVRIECDGQQFDEDLLFTHRGMSGPAVLQISNYWNSGDKITIDFIPRFCLRQALLDWKNTQSKKSLKNLLAQWLPKKFVQLWLGENELAFDSASNLSLSDIERLVATFQAFCFAPGGTEGYRTAEVTRGGVMTDDISSKTFESKNNPGLFFIGEVLDVTGWLGGFNFQWAWSSGYCAAQYV